MVKIRNEFSKLHYALTLVWLCIKCSEATIAFDFDQVKQNLFSASRVSRDYKLTENDLVCLKELKSIEAGLNTNDEWALRLLDAWGKFPSGIFSGHTIDFGAFPQCFEIKRQDEIYETKYCLGSLGLGPQIRNETEANYRVSYPRSKTGMSITFGMCVPAKCSMNLLQNLVHENELTDLNMMSIDFLEASCQVAGEPSGFTRLDYITTLILLTVLVLIIMSTEYDFYCRQFYRTPSPILLSFSVYTNGQKLLSCKRSNSPNMMECLNGMRAISTQWIVLGHTLMVYFHAPLRNKSVFVNFLARPANTYVLNSLMGVDTFLFIGGLVLSFSMLKNLSATNGKINFLMLYFHRYLRLTPIFGIMILIIASLFRYLGSGPLWPSLMASEVQTCQKWWWSSLLYVQNFVNPSDICLSQAWYLCVDMQLFIFSPFIILLIHKLKMKAIFVYLAIILASIAFTVASYVRNEFKFLAFTRGQFEAVYIPTQNRFPPWLIGVIFGYFMFNIRHKSIHIPKNLNLFAWAISLASMVAIIFISYPFIQGQSVMSSLEFGLFDTLSRVIWSIALSYIVFACVHGYGGPVNWFLSHPYFQPLNKLGYAIFLIHYPIIVWNVFTMKGEPFFSEQLLYNTFFATYMLSIFVSILATLAFESPILVLQKALLAPRNEPSSSEKTDKIQ